MYRNDTPDWLHTILALLGIVLICWLLMRDGAIGIVEPASSPSPTPASSEPESSACSHPVHNCLAKTELTFDGSSEECSERKAKSKLDEALRSPLELGECRGSVETLARNCPEGCTLLPSSQLVVPGKPLLKFSERPDEAGHCTVSVSMQVSVRATCAPQANPE